MIGCSSIRTKPGIVPSKDVPLDVDELLTASHPDMFLKLAKERAKHKLPLDTGQTKQNPKHPMNLRIRFYKYYYFGKYSVCYVIPIRIL